MALPFHLPNRDVAQNLSQSKRRNYDLNHGPGGSVRLYMLAAKSAGKEQIYE
jgi:hypothetical protein